VLATSGLRRARTILAAPGEINLLRRRRLRAAPAVGHRVN